MNYCPCGSPIPRANLLCGWCKAKRKFLKSVDPHVTMELADVWDTVRELFYVIGASEIRQRVAELVEEVACAEEEAR